MNASARSSIANVTSPPAPAPWCSRPACCPSCGATSSRSAVARSRTTLRIALTAGRALAQLHVDGLGLAVAKDLDVHGVTRVVLGDQLRQVGLVDDLVTVDGGDHVAAGPDLLSLEVDRLVGRLDARLVGRAASDHLRDDGAVVAWQAEALRQLWIERLRRDPDVRVLDLAVLAQLVERVGDEADRHRKADSLVAARVGAD